MSQVPAEILMEQAGSTAKQYMCQAVDILDSRIGLKIREVERTEVLCELIRAQSLDYLTERICNKLEELTLVISKLEDRG
jgi:hypothetical protein